LRLPDIEIKTPGITFLNYLIRHRSAIQQ